MNMKVYGGVLGDKINNWIYFGGDLSLRRGVNEQKTPSSVLHIDVINL